MSGKPGLLVSVRSAAEARAALAGGADLIDVKEPSRGPLGAADPEVIAAVVAEVAGRMPVSVAMGEFADDVEFPIPSGVLFLKWGLSGRSTLGALPPTRTRNPPHTVLVAYADHVRAKSPDPHWLAAAACRHGHRAFLIDTAIKDGSSLIDFITPDNLARIRFQLADAGIKLALAGSLDANAIRNLAPLAPDWFAVRGAACVGGREGTICSEKVRGLKTVIAEYHPAAG